MSVTIDVLNMPSQDFTFSGARGESDIDLTLLKGGQYECDWMVKSEWGISDHNPILVRMRAVVGETEVNESVSTRWNARKCNWGTYGGTVMSAAEDYGLENFHGLSAEDRINMYEWMELANDECMVRLEKVLIRKGLVWWNKDSEIKKREVVRKRKKYQKEKRREGVNVREKWTEWKVSVSEYKEMMNDAKERNWREFVGEKSRDDVWKVISVCMGKNRNDCLSALKVGDEWTKYWRESVNVLLNEFFPPDDGRPIDVGEGNERDVDDFNENAFSMNEFMSAVRLMSVMKAPGMDGITNEMIRCVCRVIPEYVKSVFDGCLNEGLFPQQWKEARVVVLLKGSGKDRTEPRSYRPISLLSGLGKVLERMLVARIMTRMDGKWNESQFGFVKNKCTEDAWDRMKECVSLSDFQYVAGVLVDFKGAFDFLLWRVILERLVIYGCTNAEMKVWMSYFKHRRVCMCNGMDAIWKDVSRGCPQGSISGPPLWNLCMNELLNELKEMSLNVVAYADDLLVLIESNTRSALETRMSKAMSVVYKWGSRSGVEVSENKTVCMMLKGGLNMSQRVVRVNIDEQEVGKLRFVEEVKYLGVNGRVHELYSACGRIEGSRVEGD